MRVSIREEDPGFVEDGQKYTVFLDGEKIQNCFTADEETGEVFVYDTDPESGELLIDFYNGDQLIKGKVKRGENGFTYPGATDARISEKRLTGKVEILKS